MAAQILLGSFTVPIPASAKSPSELADYFELNALASPDKSISALDVSSQTTKGEDEEDDRAAEDAVPDYVTAALTEIQRRSERVNNLAIYPFALGSKGDSVKFSKSAESWLYLFCLIATRANMQANRTQQVDGVALDGSRLFEEVTRYVLVHHVKVDNTIVVGTARAATDGGGVGLQGAIDGFLSPYAEAGKFVNRFNHGGSGDGGCDVIGWHSHTDSRYGKSTIFCSCKTGHSWKETSDYVPSPMQWSNAYADGKAFVVHPIPCIAVTEALSERDYAQKVEEKELLAFDRARVANAQPTVPPDLADKCRSWTREAAGAVFKIPGTSF
jgi:hypothetical protein